MLASSHAPASERSSVSEFFRGAAASATNVLLTFPLNKLISRQAYEGLTFTQALGTMRVEGASHVYRGVMPPLLQKGFAMGVMYGTYDWYYHALDGVMTGRSDPRAAIDIPAAEGALAVRAAASLLSGSTEGLLTPFERMQTLLQHRHYTEQFRHSWDVARKLAPYGVREYYRGFSAILLRNGPANAIFFVLRDPVKSLVPPLPPAGVSGRHDASSAWEVFRNFFSGAVLGAAISTVFYPLNMAKSVMQLQIGGRHRGIVETLTQVYHERGGVSGMFRGVGGNAFRSLLSWGIVNSSTVLFKDMFSPAPEVDRGTLR